MNHRYMNRHAMSHSRRSCWLPLLCTLHGLRRTALACAIAPVLLLGSASVTLMASSSAHAESNDSRSYNIPAGPLAQTLNRFGLEAGVLLSFSTEQTGKLQSRGLQGQHSVQEALQALLAGTGLEAVAQASGGYLLRTLPKTDAGNTVLPEVSVTAQIENNAVTEGTGSYTTRSTSTSTGLGLSLRETPQTVSVITRQQIEDQGLNSLPQVLKQVPGLNFEQHDSERYTMYARGFEVSNFLVDGLPVSSYPSGAYGLLYQSQMDMVAYDHVEVVKGATGLMRGAGQPSAAVNLVRKRPTRDFQASTQLTAGSWNLWRLDADVSGGFNEAGSVRGRLAAAEETKDSFIDRYSRQNTAAYGVVEADISSRLLLSVSANYVRSNVDGAPFGGAVPLFYRDGTRIELPRSWSQVPAWANWESETTTLAADLEYRFDNEWLARLSYSYQNSDSTLAGVTWEGYPRRDGSGAFAYRDEYTDSAQRDALALNISGPFNLFGRRHEAIVGLSSTISDAHDNNYYDINGYVPVNFFTDIPSMPAIGPDDRYWDSTVDARVKESAAYATLRFRPSYALSLIFGARLSNWETDTGTIRRDVTPNTFKNVEYDYRNIVTPYVGAVFDLNAQHSVYASYTDIFTPQNYRDNKGELLDPVNGNAYEAGIKGEYFEQKLNTVVSVYRITQNNLGEDTGTLFNGQPVYIAVDGAVSTGVEAEIVGQLAQGWQINAGLGHNTIEDADGQDVLTASARSNAKLFTTWQLPGHWNALTLGGGLRWQSETYKDNVGPNNDGILGSADDRLEQDSYTVADLLAAYQISKAFKIALNIDNVFDKSYLTAFRQGSQYGAPRNFKLNLGYRF